MTVWRLLLRSALLAVVVCCAVALGVTFRRVVRAHWYALAGFTGAAIVAFVATERK